MKSGALALLLAAPTYAQQPDFWKMPQLSYPDSELGARWLLWRLGCEQDWMGLATQLFFHPLTFLFIVAFLTFGAVCADYWFKKHRGVDLNIGSRVLAVSVLLAVFQWHASLEQDAMQRYESEIENANAAEKVEVAWMLPHLYSSVTKANEAVETARDRFVYIHLDNLEYAIERYRDGFASAQTTVRAVMTFAIHCRETDFKARAQRQVLGYSPLVQKVAGAVFDRT